MRRNIPQTKVRTLSKERDLGHNVILRASKPADPRQARVHVVHPSDRVISTVLIPARKALAAHPLSSPVHPLSNPEHRLRVRDASTAVGMATTRSNG